jgi:hypothetical protein
VAAGDGPGAPCGCRPGGRQGPGPGRLLRTSGAALAGASASISRTPGNPAKARSARGGRRGPASGLPGQVSPGLPALTAGACQVCRSRLNERLIRESEEKHQCSRPAHAGGGAASSAAARTSRRNCWRSARLARGHARSMGRHPAAS